MNTQRHDGYNIHKNIVVLFTLACAVGFFGQNCSRLCNNTCTGCNKLNGICDTGCRPGWKGEYCEERNYNLNGSYISYIRIYRQSKYSMLLLLTDIMHKSTCN